MKSLTKKLLSIFMVLCLTLLSFGLAVNVNAVEVIAYHTGFNIDEGFTTDTNYKGNVIQGSATQKWEIEKGCFSSSSKIEGDASVAIRVYPKNTTFGYLRMNFDIANATKVNYQAKASTTKGGKILIDINYSIDQGKTWISIEQNKALTSSATTYSFNVPTDVNSSQIRFEFVISKSTIAPTSSKIQLTIDDITIYQEKNIPTLATPTATLSGRTVTITPVANASSYTVALFDGTTLAKEYTNCGTTFEIPFTAQGSFDVKVIALGDNTNYGNSEYTTSLGKITNSEIKKVSIADFKTLPIDKDEKYHTYYQLSGTIVSTMFDFNKTIVVIEDATGQIKLFGISQSKTIFDQIDMATLIVGNVLTVNGIRGDYHGEAQGEQNYFISQEADYLGNFTGLQTLGSLNASYVTKQKQVEVPGGETVNTVFSNLFTVDTDLTELNLSKAIKMVFDIGTHTNNAPKYYKSDSTIRGYKGNTITIVSENEISSLKLTITQGAGLYTLTNATAGVDGAIIPNSGAKTITITFTGSVRFTKLDIITTGETHTIPEDYFEISKDQQTNKNNVALRFGALVTEELYNKLLAKGTTVKFGVVYAKASELGTKTFDAAVADKTAHVEECAPELVGTDYQFAIVLNHIPATAFDDAVTAACYVEIDGVMHLMNAKTYSVNGIALEYVNAHADDANVKEHLEMLKWLSTYKETITK